jgi:hypothetical protein
MKFGETTRIDMWWLKPLAIFIGLTTFIVYSTWAALQNGDYMVAGTGYLSPFYSPILFGPEGGAHSAWFGSLPEGWPDLLRSPAIFILWAPAGFRLTCYYYRGAYYKSHWASPLACGVGKPHKNYTGERSFPLIVQNLHRYFLYLALGFILVLSYDAYCGMWFTSASGATEFGIGVGTLVMIMNVILLSLYTLGCHSLRHLVGGARDVLSGNPIRKKAYDCVSCLNKSHQKWAWMSLFWVGFTDVYVRLCSMGVLEDWRIL